MEPTIADNIAKLKDEVAPYNAKIVLVTKKRSKAEIMQAYDAGLSCFGENRVQEFVDKVDEFPAGIEWHFVGHLQRNKIKDILDKTHLIHSGDRERLLMSLEKEAEKQGVNLEVLLQFHIAEEEAKHGLSLEEAEKWLSAGNYDHFNHVWLAGVMGMATNTEDQDKIKREFSTLSGYFSRLKEKYFRSESSFRELSMGMSGDYQIALEEGSTMIRVGQTVFGPRPE